MTKTPDLSKLVGKKIVSVPMLHIGSPLRAEIVKGLMAGRSARIRKLERSFGDEIFVVREVGAFRIVHKSLVSRCYDWIKRLLFGGVL